MGSGSKRNGNEIQKLNLRVAEINASLKEIRRSLNIQLVNEEWQQFFRGVSEEIGKERAIEIKKNAEKMARSKYSASLREVQL